MCMVVFILTIIIHWHHISVPTGICYNWHYYYTFVLLFGIPIVVHYCPQHVLVPHWYYTLILLSNSLVRALLKC